MNTERENRTSIPSSKIKNESECTIGDICSRFSSGKGITAERISHTGEYPVYGGNGIRGYTDSYNFEGQCVVIGRQGANCGNVKYFDGKAYMSEHAIVGVTHQEHDNRYFAYKLSMLNLGRFSGQAAQPGLSVAKLKTLKITMPNFNIQYRIASILSSYDRLIENNTRRIRLLEQMAENLYKEWFVRFRFPEHEKVEMVNGLPKGWKINSLKEICEFKRGRNITSAEMCDGIIQVISAGVAPSGYHNKANVHGVSVTMSSSGANAGYISIHYDDIWAADCSYISEKETEDIYYVYELLNNIRQVINNFQIGAAQPHVYPKDINRIKTCVPPKELRIKANTNLSKIHKEIHKLYKQNQLLTRQRDLLLPRLMSGKLEVKS